MTAPVDGSVIAILSFKTVIKLTLKSKMNYEEAMEAKLNAAALHFDVSRLNTIAADAQNNVTSLDNLGADSTRAMASRTRKDTKLLK